MITFLEAVNICLATIGEAPVSVLSDSGINETTDSAHAQRTLSEVSQSVQSEGWSWNTDRSYVVMPNADNTFSLPDTTLIAHLSPTDYSDNRFAVRGLRIWDTSNHTFTITDQTDGIVVDRLVSFLEWEWMPHSAQHYVSIRSARVMADRYVNSNAIYAYTANDEDAARATMLRQETESGRYNMLWGNRSRRNVRGYGFVPADGTRYRTN